LKLTSSPRLIVPAPQFAHSLHGLGSGNIAPIWQGHSGNKPNSGEQCITLQNLGKSCHTAYVIYILYYIHVVRLGKLAPYPHLSTWIGRRLGRSSRSQRDVFHWASRSLACFHFETHQGRVMQNPIVLGIQRRDGCQTDLPCSKILGQSHVISRDSRVDLPQLSCSMESRGISRLARRSIHAVR
jgi:hypothetical protein